MDPTSSYTMGHNYYRPKAKPKLTTTMKIGTGSYVEIAVNTIMHDTDLEDLLALSMHDYTKTSPRSGDELRSDWTARVEDWQRTYPNGGVRVEDLTMITELHFGALFLQRPDSAMYLWTMMQAFYALDRLVCCKPATEPERWSHFTIPDYLESKVIQSAWKKSLPVLRKDINKASTNVPKMDRFFAATNDKGSHPTDSRARKEALRRTDGIAAGITKLEDAHRQLIRNWSSLKGIQVAESLLWKINEAADIRFAMIKNLDVDTVEAALNEPISEQEKFPSLRRSDSFGTLKRELESAWKSTERGDASPFAIIILLLLLLCLHRARKYLLAGSEVGFIS
ncbi:hypothetical protein VTL71DRAFT_13164 [Oculimacula yallundae]|uniref:Uncharacterized protein n=1 Tax=Oculimacula yallundae TaxID=86028 RepID=A0ABR4CS76_9HELO